LPVTHVFTEFYRSVKRKIEIRPEKKTTFKLRKSKRWNGNVKKWTLEIELPFTADGLALERRQKKKQLVCPNFVSNSDSTQSAFNARYH